MSFSQDPPPATSQTVSASPTSSFVTSALVMLAGVVVGYLVKSGIISQADAATVSSAIVAILGGVGLAAYKALSHTRAAKIAAAAALPEVSRIVTTSAIANSATFATDRTVVSVAEARTSPAPVPVNGP